MPDSRRFEYPKFRHLVAIYLLMQVGLAIALVLYETLVSPTSEPAALSQPLLEPVFYLIVFGCASLWVAQQYRQRGIELKAIMGLPVAWAQWPAIVGLWITLFMFSMGAFQVSFALLSLAFPEYVRAVVCWR